MIFRLEDLKEYQWNPMVYNLGSAVYPLVAREFAPLPERMANLQLRLQSVAEVVSAAKANLRNPPGSTPRPQFSRIGGPCTS